MKNNNLKPQFAIQYLAIVSTIEDQIGIRQGDIAKANAKLASRGTILSRLTDLMNAGVVKRAWSFGPPSEVRYQVLNTAPLDALSNDGIVLDESEDEICDRVRNEFAPLSHENKWLSFRHLYNESVKDEGARADQDLIIECVGSDSLTTQEIQSLTDISAQTLKNDLEDLVRAGRLALHNHRYFAPVETPQTVETPVEAPAPVEAPVAAPTPALTLCDIIEQAVQAAVGLRDRENEARIAELTVERDKLRDLAETAQARFAAAESAMLTIRQVVGLGTV